MKSLLLTVSLALLGSALAERTEYRVQKGDTAFSIARRSGLSVDALLAMNGLTDSGVKVGQVLVLDVPAASAPVPSVVAGAPFEVAAPAAAQVRLSAPTALRRGGGTALQATVAPSATLPAAQPAPVTAALPTAGRYQVVRGDTAFSIARRYGLSVDALLALNGLTDSGVKVGQWLSVGPPAQMAAAPVSRTPSARPAPAPVLAASVPAAPPSSIVVTPLAPASALPDQPVPEPMGPQPMPAAPLPSSTPPAQAAVNLGDPLGVALVTSGPPGSVRARLAHLLGVPYLYGGTGERGVDCSGLVLQVMAPMGISLPRRSAEQYGAGVPVDRAALAEGDLVFFDTQGRGQVSHVGIYVGDDYFAHANSYDGRVTVNRLSERYYAGRYLGARRVLGPTPGLAAQPGSTWTVTSAPSGSR